ncbi:MAG: tetratricopeptide repeat protein [Gemmatimonadota bacterium]
MKTQRVVPVVLTVLLLAACGAGSPQNEAVRDEAVLALWPLTTSSDEARQSVADGVRELDMGRSEEASAHFERAVTADPNAAMAHLWASAAAQSLESSFAHLAKATELAAGASEVERTIIQMVQKSVDNDAQGALALAQQLVQLEADNPRAWMGLADMHNAQAQRVEARAAWDKAMQVAPNFAPAYLAASQSYVLVEPFDLAKAEQLARKAVELEPNEPLAHDVLGDALRAQGKLNDAALSYTKAAELDPTQGDGLQQRGHVNTFLGRYAEARADYDAAVAVATGNAKPGLAMYRALVHVHEGNLKAALAELEQQYSAIDAMNIAEPIGLKMFVASPQFNIAVTSGMIPDAERYAARLEQLAQMQIQQAKSEEFGRGARAGITARAATLAIYKGDLALARQKVAEYMEIRAPESNPARNRPAHDLLGLIALKEMRHADAVAEFEQGSPNNIWMNYQHALALEGAGRAADAQRLYNKVANYYFNSEGLALVRKAALAKVGKPTT